MALADTGLSEEQYRRLSDILWRRGVSYTSLTSSEELHQFAWNYTWEDGVEPLDWVIRHASCDRGTALLVFWHAYPRCNWRTGEAPSRFNYAYFFHDPDDLPDFDRDVCNLLKEVRERYTSDQYVLGTISYDPHNDGGLDLTKEYRATSSYLLPAKMNRATPGRKLERAVF